MDAQVLKLMQADPAEFRDRLLIDGDDGPVPLGPRLDSWQRKDFEAMDPAWRRIAGQQVEVPYSRAWLERPRGHSKSQDAALMGLWCLSFAVRIVVGVVCACDRDQAALIRQGIERILSHNAWLSQVICVNQWKVSNRRTGSELTIMASDVASSWGLLIDFAILDEVSQWPKDDLWVSLLSAIAKKKHAVLVAAMNAGWCDTWPEKTRQKVSEDPNWYFNALPGSCASWIGKSQLAEQRRLLPATSYARLWENQWSPTSGDALSADDISRVFAGDLPAMDAYDSNYKFAGGLDLSVSRDFSAFVIVGKHRSGRYRVARCWLWKPPRGRKIDLERVETTIREAHRFFRLKTIVADPFQAEYLVSRLQKSGIRIEARPQVGKSLVEQCMLLLEQINSSNLESYRFEPLERDLLRLRVEEKAYGLRLVSDRGVHGHGDTVSALTLALVAAKKFSVYVGSWGGVINLSDVRGGVRFRSMYG